MLGIFGYFIAFNVWSVNGYLCLSDSTTGFYMDDGTKEWRPTVFNKNRKFTITRDDEHPWKVSEVGSDSWLIKCKSEFSGDNLSCGHGFLNLRMSKKTNRYLLTSDVGYWDFMETDETFAEGAKIHTLKLVSALNFKKRHIT